MNALPETKTALRAIILQAHQAMLDAGFDAKNCAAMWRQEHGEGETSQYLEAKRAGIEEARILLEREIGRDHQPSSPP
jgi:hypothetical protein